MIDLQFSWDNEKDRQNRRKHGVSFEEAASVFYDENARFISDPDHSDEEDRFILLGMSGKLRILLVCHSYREGESLIRIISSRKANRKEQKQYVETLL